MSTHYSDIASALDTQLNLLGETVAWENRHFTPPTSGLYLMQFNIPASTTQADLGTNGTDYTVGIYQVSVVGVFGKGKAAIYTLSDSVADQFKRGTVMTYNGTTVRVKTVERAPMLIDEQSAIIPISVTYETYTTARA